MSQPERQAILVGDLGYGDAGKGSIADYLTRRHHAHTVVRYNGGAQAAHTVVEASGRQHTFAQFGSGTLVPGTRTHLSRFMLVNPLSMLKEEQHLSSIGITDAFQQTSIDADALITTPFQQSANRLQELARADQRHGSCGMGIGETMADALAYGSAVLFARDLPHRATILHKLRFLREIKRGQIETIRARLSHTEQVARELKTLDEPEVLEDCADLYQFFAGLVEIVDGRTLGRLLAQPGTVIFEGAQGVLLDEWHGFHPYTTWCTTILKNAETLLQEQAYTGAVTRLGVLRAYATRHGAGPFVTEDAQLSASLPDVHNGQNPWQQAFRVGYLDLVATRYALAVAGQIDCLAVTNLDRLAQLPTWQVCSSYSYMGEGDADLAQYFETAGNTITGIKVSQPASLGHQEQLTQRLWRCLPLYQSIPATSANCPADATAPGHRGGPDVSAYLAWLEQHLRLPIRLTSFGPTAQDKHPA